MPILKVTLVKGDRRSPIVDYVDALPTNMYAIKRPVLNADGYLLGYPGLKEFGRGVGFDRGAVYNENTKTHYRVSGNKFISVDTLGEYEELGTVDGRDMASMIDFYSLYSQGLIANGKFYTYNPNLEPNFFEMPSVGDPFIDGVWIDGYYFLATANSLWHTKIKEEEEGGLGPEDAEREIDPDSYGSSDFSPDPIVGLVKTENNSVAVFGRYSTEYFVNEGTEIFKFKRIEGSALRIGIVSPHAKCELDGKVYIVGSRKNESLGVYVFEQGDISKISNRSIDELLTKYTDDDLKEMSMEARAENDVSFIIIHLPEETLCFNKTVAREFGFEQAWFKLRTGTDFYRARNGIYDPRINRYIYGDRTTNLFGILDEESIIQYGDKTEWTLYSPLLKLETYSINEIEVEIIPGFNTSFEAETVEVSVTTDGITYGNPIWTLYGKLAEYNNRFILRRLGICNNWIGFRFRGVTSSRLAFALMTLKYS